ncbi:peptidoglycan-binding protein [Streptomyces sp. NPDC048484]|uniref:efflux RND transporter periplasmic adaptor subunit n=1 Tax=Streptomyces sp. NPDC048484 TaxID=3155146 RepID=UPI00341441B5
MKPRTIAISLTALTLVAGGAVVATEYTGSDSAEASDGQDIQPSATAAVEQGDLVSSISVDGTLGYTKKKKINAGTAGTLTWVAGNGAKIKQGGRLYAVDGKDVRLMYGTEPMYRKLKKGNKGTDVRQLKANLIAAGLGGGIVEDKEFTDGTVYAVKRWQKKYGLRQTGEMGPEHIAFATGPVRVQETVAAAGDRATPGGAVLTVTSSERVVQLQVKVSQAALVKQGRKVRIDTPEGSSTSGTVASIAASAQTGDDPNDKTPRIGVTVAFDDPSKISGLDKSSATVRLTGETRKNVLSVPVSALLAMTDGSFGVQVVENGRTRQTPVTLGMFAQGRVEISGKGLRDGMKVGVPKS